jgi:methyltransferase (TIGR00027 family)
VRTSLIDEAIVSRAGGEGVDTVLNLGSGFDTRPYRLPLAKSLRWFDVDLPSVIAHKAGVLSGASPCCYVELIALDLANRIARCALFRHIAESANKVLIVAEGLLGYMTAQQVGELAQDMHAQESFQRWIFDLASPLALALIGEGVGARHGDSGPTLRFAPEEGPDFFAPFGWAPVDYRSCFEAGHRLQRHIIPEAVAAMLTNDQRRVLRTLTGVVTLTRIASATVDPYGRERPSPA